MKSTVLYNILTCFDKKKNRITVNQRFDVSNIILKIEVVCANVKVVIRVEDFEYIMSAFHSA